MAATKNSYAYHKISQLSPGMKSVNVIGVVSYFRPPARSRGPDFSCTIGLLDDSGQSLKCMLFNGELTKLPASSDTGDILCVRRGNVSVFDGKLQLICNRISSWLLFQGRSNSPLCSSSNCTLTDVEINRAKELRKWTATSPSLQGSSHSSLKPSPVASLGLTANQTLLPSNLPNTPLLSSSCWNQQTPPPGVHRNTRLSLTTLGALSAGRSGVAVCGIVLLFKSATRSRGKDYYSTVWLLDHTSPKQAVSFTVFSPIEQLLPKDIPIGSIVLLKGLKTSSYQGRLQARGYESTLIAVFPNSPGAALPIVAGWYHPVPQEIEVVRQLQIWSQQQGVLLLNTTFNQISIGHFFDTICRVAAIHSCAGDHLTVLEVFDGTIPRLERVNRDTRRGKWTTSRDVQLCATYAVCICEVHLNAFSQPIRPGDFIALRNVHAMPLSSGTEPDNCQVQFTVLPKHMSGAVEVLDGRLSGDIAEFITNFPVPLGPFPVFMRPSSSIPDVSFEVLDKEFKRHALVEEALRSPIGSVFVVEGQITRVAYGPVEEFSQLRCLMCTRRYATPQSSDPLLPDDVVCTFCSDSTGMGPPVCFTYVFLLSLQDVSGTLEICVTATEAEKFLQGLPPVNLYVDIDSRERLVNVLYAVTGGNDPFYPVSTGVEYERPKVECCVTPFTSTDGITRFSLMDTVCKIFPKM